VTYGRTDRTDGPDRTDGRTYKHRHQGRRYNYACHLISYVRYVGADAGSGKTCVKVVPARTEEGRAAANGVASVPLGEDADISRSIQRAIPTAAAKS
jgi:hypothetical protein